jgi:hypothetical protein
MCSALLPLSQLRKHVTSCSKKESGIERERSKSPVAVDDNVPIASSVAESHKRETKSRFPGSGDFLSSPPWDKQSSSSPELPSPFLIQKRRYLIYKL